MPPAYARSLRERRRHWAVRWLFRLAMVPVAGFYVLIVFFSQFVHALAQAALRLRDSA